MVKGFRVARGLGGLHGKRGFVGIVALGLAALLGLVLLTRDQCRIWRSPVSLWVHTLNHGLGRSSKADVRSADNTPLLHHQLHFICGQPGPGLRYVSDILKDYHGHSDRRGCETLSRL